MHPYSGYGYPFPSEIAYPWYPPLMGHQREICHCYSCHMHRSCTVPYEPSHYSYDPVHAYKVQQNASIERRNALQHTQSTLTKSREKKMPKPKGIQKPLAGTFNIYAHPKKKVKHRVRYFDPSAAPIVTSGSYNLVEDTLKQDDRAMLLQQIDEYVADELQHPEIQESPFIVYKYRRIKKKFKKYIRTKEHHQANGQDVNQHSDNEEEQESEENSSDSELFINNQKFVAAPKFQQNTASKRNVVKRQNLESDESYRII